MTNTVWVSSAAIKSPGGRIVGVPPTQGDKFTVAGRVIEQKDRRIQAWRRMIATAIRTCDWQPLMHGPIHVKLTFLLPRPARHYGTGRNQNALKPGRPSWCPTKPDADKLARAVLDGLTKCGAIGDDAQIAVLEVTKRYSDTGEVGVWIEAETIQADTQSA